jgi:predicted Zn-dependent protease
VFKITAIDTTLFAHYTLAMISRSASFCGFRNYCSLLVVLSFIVGNCSLYRRPLAAVGQPSEDDETRIGREFRREAKKHLKLVTNPEVERYIDRIGQRILSAMGPQPFDYRFFVVNDSQLNAFAVPGGSIYFYTGLIEKAKSTSEIAGVMGHEIVHIKGRHMARSSGPDAVSLLGLLGMLLLARSGTGAQAAGAIGQAVAATRQIAYTRQLEMEADTLGVRYMASAGYDPKGALGFLKTLDQERALNPIETPAYMMTHPVTQDRVANVELVIRSLARHDAKIDETDHLKRVQTIIRMERDGGEKLIDDYENRLRPNPDDTESLHLLAFAQQLKGLLPQARRNYEKLRQLDPNRPALDRDLGRLYSELGEFRLARTAFDRALAAEPREPLTYLYLGELCEREGDLRAAAGSYLNAHNLSPRWDKPLNRLGMVYGKLNRLGDAYYYLGRSFVEQDEDEKAIADYEKAIKILGNNSPRAELIREELNALKARRR